MDPFASFRILTLALWLSTLSHAQNCGYNTTSLSGTISGPIGVKEYTDKTIDCSWTITAPHLHRTQLLSTSFKLYMREGMCRTDWIHIDSLVGNDQIATHGTFCAADSPNIISKENKVRITYHHSGYYNRRDTSYFTFTYKAVPLSPLELAKYWTEHIGLEKENLPKAVSSLFLIDENYFLPGNRKGENVTNQFRLQLGEDLVRNLTRPLTAGDLSLRVSALLAACINPRSFYGVDLVRHLRELVSKTSGIPNPYLLLTLCNSGEEMTDHDIKKLTTIVETQKHETYWLDYQAMALLTLVCVKEQNNVHNVRKQMTKAMEEIKSHQLGDGGFGSLQTTSLVIQALAAAESGETGWNRTFAMRFINSARQSDGLYGSIQNLYAVTPVISGKTLLHINISKCDFTQDEETNLNEINANLTHPIRLSYSLWLGDHVDVTYTVTLKAPKGTKFLDFMRLAADLDEKFKFRWINVKNAQYVYVIGGLINDPSSGRYWTLYVGPHMMDLQPLNKGLDHYIPKNNEVAVMWYKTVAVEHAWEEDLQKKNITEDFY